MNYRKFGSLDWRGSALGFGTMRLPVIGEDQANIDEDLAVSMIRYAIDHGVNYMDSAYPYHMGKSEIVLGKALEDGYRDKVMLATKLPPWMVNNSDDFDRIFNEQLEKMQTDRIDFYLLHNQNKANWRKLRDLGILNWAEKAMASGRFGHLGFSIHDDFDHFKSVIDAYDNWTLCQIQYNFMDENYQAGTRGLEYAAGKGLAVVIMEPLRGGRLTKRPPEQIKKLWASAKQQRSPAEWALRWVWNHPEVSLLLSGMSTMKQVEENVVFASLADYDKLTPEELTLVGKVRDMYRELSPIACTACGYCMPCPNGVEIPGVLGLYNDAIMYNDAEIARLHYEGPVPAALKEHQRADKCAECNECIDKCPQSIPVPDWMKKAHELLSSKK